MLRENVKENITSLSEREEIQIKAEEMVRTLLLRIQHTRIVKDIPQYEMANKSGLVQEAISRIETRVRKFDEELKGMKVSTLFKLVKSLDLTLCLKINGKTIKVETREELIATISQHRTEIKKSTRKLAAENGMKQPTIVRFETKKPEVNITTVARIAIPLGISFGLEEIKK